MANSLQQDITNIVSKLKNMEFAIAELYSAFSGSYEEDREFWLALRKEELIHVSYLQKMLDIINSNYTAFSFGRPIHETTIDKVIEYVDLQRACALSKETPLFKFLTIAKDFEETVLENGFYSIVISKDLEFITLSKKIIADTKAHRQKIIDKLKSRK